jgi:hypothetical protein
MFSKPRTLLFGAALLCLASATGAQDIKPVGNAAPATKPTPLTESGQQRSGPAPADPFASVPPAKPEDVKSMDAIITALYSVSFRRRRREAGLESLSFALLSGRAHDPHRGEC